MSPIPIIAIGCLTSQPERRPGGVWNGSNLPPMNIGLFYILKIMSKHIIVLLFRVHGMATGWKNDYNWYIKLSLIRSVAVRLSSAVRYRHQTPFSFCLTLNCIFFPVLLVSELTQRATDGLKPAGIAQIISATSFDIDHAS